MALIPKDSKTNGMQDNGIGLEIAIIIFLVYMIFDTFLGKYISSSLNWVFGILVVFVIGYMIIPNNKNKGKNGYQRIAVLSLKSINFWNGGRNTYGNKKASEQDKRRK